MMNPCGMPFQCVSFKKKRIGMTRSLEAGHLEPLKVESCPFGNTLLHCNADKNKKLLT